MQAKSRGKRPCGPQDTVLPPPLDSRGAGSTSVYIFPSPPPQGHYVPGSEELTEFGLPRWSVIKNLSANAGDMGDMGSIPGLGRSPGGEKWPPTSIFLPGKSHEQRSLVGYRPWGCKESGMTEQLSTHTHSLFGECKGG